MSDEWLDALRVGDTVVVLNGYGRGRWLGKVERVTPKFVDVEGSRYRKRDGREHGGSTWHSRAIAEATPEKVEEVRREVALTNARAALAAAHWYGLPEDVVLATFAAYKRAAAPDSSVK
jgi:ribosomal protein L24